MCVKSQAENFPILFVLTFAWSRLIRAVFVIEACPALFFPAGLIDLLRRCPGSIATAPLPFFAVNSLAC
jgi:hypothetical protein